MLEEEGIGEGITGGGAATELVVSAGGKEEVGSSGSCRPTGKLSWGKGSLGPGTRDDTGDYGRSHRRRQKRRWRRGGKMELTPGLYSCGGRREPLGVLMTARGPEDGAAREAGRAWRGEERTGPRGSGCGADTEVGTGEAARRGGCGGVGSGGALYAL